MSLLCLSQVSVFIMYTPLSLFQTGKVTEPLGQVFLEGQLV